MDLIFLKNIFNNEQIILDKDELNFELNNCIDIKREVLALVKPRKEKEIIDLIKECNKNKVEIYVYSSGNNWGYGSKNPVKSGCILIDLSEFNKILKIDSALSFAKIQAGVTQGQLSKYLLTNKSDLICNVTGAGPNCSIIGNSLERGFGVGFYNESFDQIIDLKVLLPNGDILNTGYEHFKNNSLKHCRGDGLGPDLKGLFAQSNLGIVLEATIKLQRKSKYNELMIIYCDEDEKLFNLLEDVRELKHEGILTNTVQFFNKTRLISVLKGKPNLEENKMSDEEIKYFSKKFGLTNWGGMSLIWGSKDLIKVKKKRIKEICSKNNLKVRFFSENKIKFLKKNVKFLSLMRRTNMNPFLDSLHQAFDFFSGKPFIEALNTCYYRNTKKPVDFNPARENCGLFWVSPIAPLTSQDESKVYEIIKKKFDKYEFDLFMTINVISERQITNIVGLTYNKENFEEVQRAKDCHFEVIGKLIKEGYLSYRLGIEDMFEFIDKNDLFWQKIYEIKSTLDKNHILSPGRYCLKNEKN